MSAVDQYLDRQLIAADGRGIQSTNVFTEKLSGKDTKRPELRRLMGAVKSGDTVIVESISRFARNTRDLLDLVDKLNSKGAEFVSLKENIDTTTPTGKFMLTVFGAVAELERGYSLQRQSIVVVAGDYHAGAAQQRRHIAVPVIEIVYLCAVQVAADQIRPIDIIRDAPGAVHFLYDPAVLVTILRCDAGYGLRYTQIFCVIRAGHHIAAI